MGHGSAGEGITLLLQHSHWSIPVRIPRLPSFEKASFPTLKTVLQIPESRKSSHSPPHPLQPREDRLPSQPQSAGLVQHQGEMLFPPKTGILFSPHFSESQLGEFRLPLKHWGEMRQEDRAEPPIARPGHRAWCPRGSAGWAKARTELWMCKMLTQKHQPVPSDYSMHTSSIPGWRVGSRCLVRERRHQPQTTHTPLQLGQV